MAWFYVKCQTQNNKYFMISYVESRNKKKSSAGVGKMGETVKRYKVWVMNKINDVQHGD